jgi:hypothetical protein
MKMLQVTSSITAMIRAGEPVMLVGPPGVGKTEVLLEAAKDTGREIVLYHPVVCEPIDFRGLPARLGDRAEFLPFGDLRRLIGTSKPTLAIFDDLGQAPQAVQAAVMQLILARTIGEHQISDTVAFAAATNRSTDRAGVHGILAPLTGRFTAVIHVESDVDSWTQWAYRHEIDASIIGFARFRPGLLSEEPPKGIHAFCCPRSLVALNRLLRLGIHELEMWQSAIGDGAGAEYAAFQRHMKDLPTVAEIIALPKKTTLPKEASGRYAICAALALAANEQNAEQIVEYSSRLGAEYDMMLHRDMLLTAPQIAATTAFVKWAAANDAILCPKK